MFWGLCFLNAAWSSWICCLFADYYSPGLAHPSPYPQSGHDRGRSYLAASCGTQPVSLWGAVLLSSSSLLGLPGMLQGSFTGQQSLGRLRGNRSHSLSAWMGSGREQLRMWVLHAVQSIGNVSKEGRQLQSVILATEGCKCHWTAESPWGRQCAVCLQQLPWVKHTDHTSTCSIREQKMAFHIWGSADETSSLLEAK